MNIFSMSQSLALGGKILDTKKPTEPLIHYNSYKPVFQFEMHSTPLERATPESVGVPSGLIRAFLERIKGDKTLNMHDVLVLRNGKLICEVAFGAQRTDVWKQTFSACKSITSLAIGMLVDDGLLSLDEKVVSLFPNEVGAVARLRLKDLFVRNLLTMQSTLTFAEVDSATDEEWIRAFFASSTQGEIGKTFHYNSLNTYILSAIVTKKTGKSLSEFLDERLFAPLGIVDYYWEQSPENIDKGGWGLYIRPSDIAKIAVMVMDDGIYQGNRIISAEYLRQATTVQARAKDGKWRFDYGYQIWVGRETDSFLFNGMLGQNVLGFRRNGIVLVTHAGNNEFFQSSAYFQYAKEYFDRDFEDKLPNSCFARYSLSRAVSSLSLYRECFFSKRYLRSPKAKRVYASLAGNFEIVKGDFASIGAMPLLLQAVQSEYTKGLEKLVLSIENGVPCFCSCEKEETHVFPLGFGKPIIKNHDFGDHHFLVASTATLRQNEDDLWVLAIRLDFLETPFSRLIKMIFHDDRVETKFFELPGEGFVSDLAGDALKEGLEKPIVASIFEKIGDDYMDWRLKKAFSPAITLNKKTPR